MGSGRKVEGTQIIITGSEVEVIQVMPHGHGMPPRRRPPNNNTVTTVKQPSCIITFLTKQFSRISNNTPKRVRNRIQVNPKIKFFPN